MSRGTLAILLATTSAMLWPVTAEARRASSRVEIAWAGGPTLRLRFGPISVLTDPVLGEGETAFRIFDPNSGAPNVAQARLTALPDLSYEHADLVLVSHAHEDHLDATALERLGSRVHFLVPEEQATRVRTRGAARVTGIEWGGSHVIEREGYRITVTAVPARHSENPNYLAVLGKVNGYWLEFSRGRYRRTIYWTGDSFAPAEGVQPLLVRPDLLIPHLGGVGANGPIGPVSMTSAHAIAFARMVRPRAVLPVHHSTFTLYREPIESFERAAAAEPYRLERVREGGRIVLR